MLLKALNSIHLPTFVMAFVAVFASEFVIYFNGTPVDLSTNQGRANLSAALIGLLIAALQKATPSTPAK